MFLGQHRGTGAVLPNTFNRIRVTGIMISLYPFISSFLLFRALIFIDDGGID